MRVLFTPECQNKKNVICRKGLQDPVTNLCDLAGFEILITPAQKNESNYEALEAMATSLGKSHKSGLQKNPEVSRTSTICATQIHGIDAFLAVRAIRAPCRIRVQSAQCRMSETSEEFGWGTVLDANEARQSYHSAVAIRHWHHRCLQWLSWQQRRQRR